MVYMHFVAAPLHSVVHDIHHVHSLHTEVGQEEHRIAVDFRILNYILQVEPGLSWELRIYFCDDGVSRKIYQISISHNFLNP
jgi:hypothetical protein